MTKNNFISRKEYQINVKTMTDKMDNITKELGLFKVQLAELPEKLIEKLDQRYAEKKVEKVVYGMIGLILTAVIVAVLALIIKNG